MSRLFSVALIATLVSLAAVSTGCRENTLIAIEQTDSAAAMQQETADYDRMMEEESKQNLKLKFR